MAIRLPARSEAAPTLDTWLRAWGFVYDSQLGRVRNPFDFLSAENDPSLPHCYVPLLDESLFLRPEHLVVLGPSGGGKTAVCLKCQQKLRDAYQPHNGGAQGAGVEGEIEALTDLRKWMMDHFSSSELDLLRSDLLRSNEDRSSAITLEQKAYHLIQDCKRHERLPDLLALCREQRQEFAEFLRQIEGRLFPPPPTLPNILVYTSFHQARADLLPPRRPQQHVSRSPDQRYVCIDIADDDEDVFGRVDAEDAEPFLAQDNLKWLANNGLYLRAFVPLWFERLTGHIHDRIRIEWNASSRQELIRNRLAWARGNNPTLEFAKICDSRLQLKEDLGATLACVGRTPRGVLAVGHMLFLCHAPKLTNGEPDTLTFRDKIAAFTAIGKEAFL